MLMRGNDIFSLYRFSLATGTVLAGVFHLSIFTTKNKIIMSASPTVHVSNKLNSQAQLLKCHHHYIETLRYSSVINLHTRVHLTEVHVKFCQAGSQVGIETYGER